MAGISVKIVVIVVILAGCVATSIAQQHKMMSINHILVNAIEKYAAKASRKLLCKYVTDKIESWSDKGDITSDDEYVELRVSKQKFVPLFSLLPMKLTSPKLSFISYDCHENELVIKTTLGITLQIIPGIMKLENMELTIEAKLTSVQNSLLLVTTGVWKLGPLTIKTYIAYHPSSGSAEIQLVTESINIDHVVKLLTGLKLPGVPQKLPSFTISGNLESDGSATLILHSDSSKRNKFYAFYQQERGQKAPAKAVAVEITKLKLSTILMSTIRFDISRVPFFGRLAVKNIGLILSSGIITNLPKNIFAKTRYLIQNGVVIEPGLKAFFKLPFLSKPVTMEYSRGTFRLQSDSKELGLLNVLNKLGSKIYLGKLRLPKQLKAILRLYINEIIISKNKLTLTIMFPKPVSFFNKFLVFSNVIVSLYLSNQHPKLSVKVTGNIILAGAKFRTALVQDRWKKYTLSAKGDYLDIQKVLHKFSASVLPEAVSAFLKGIPFLHFGIQKPTIIYKFMAKPMLLRLSGTPVINGFRTLHYDAIITKIRKKIQIIMGFELLKINIADTLQKITKFNFKPFGILNQEVAFLISISPINARYLQFNRGGLKGVPIRKGVSLSATIRFPDNCDRQRSCRIFSSLIGKDASLSIQATISSATYFPLSASIANIQLGKFFKLHRASIVVVGGTAPSVGLVGAINLKKPWSITLSATISLNTKGLTLGMSLGGCIKHIFGAKWLSICNLLGSTSFTPSTGVSGIELGGEIRLGYKSTGHQFKAKGYIGINIQDPQENYYYVSFSRATMHSFLKAFKVDVQIPKVLKESAFPKGFLSSFSLLGKELPGVHLSIQAGFRFKGELNILGIKGTVDININYPKRISYEVILPPIKMADGQIKIYASPTASLKGPHLKAAVQLLPKPYVDVKIDGYVHILGIILKKTLKISNAEYKLFVEGKLLGLYQANFLAYASYGNIQTAKFRVKGDFKSDLYINIETTLIRKLNQSVKKATAAINKAKGALERAKSPFNHGIGKLNQAQRKVNNARAKFHQAANHVANTRRRLLNHCRIKTCPKFWGVPDPKCTIRNAACWTYRKGVQVALTIAEKAVRGATVTLHAANAALWVAKRLVSAARATLDKAKNILRAVSWAYRYAVKAASWIIRYSLKGLISIHRMYFNTRVESVRTGHFTAGIDVTFRKTTRVNSKVHLNIKCVICIAREIGRQMGRGIYELLR